MFNIIPHTNIDDVPANVFDFLALATVLISAVTLTVKGLRRAPIGRQLVCGVAILSIAGVSILFLLNQWGPGISIYIGRFFPNLYFFGVLLVGMAVAQSWERLHVAVKTAVMAYALLLIASGLASYPRLWTGQAPIQTSNSITDFGSFLERNGLTYGYGPYWGSEALAMNWMTGGRVTIRPVAFTNNPNQVDNFHPQEFNLWYVPGDEPAGTPETFLVINDDGENCASVEFLRRDGDPPIRCAISPAYIREFGGAGVASSDRVADCSLLSCSKVLFSILSLTASRRRRASRCWWAVSFGLWSVPAASRMSDCSTTGRRFSTRPGGEANVRYSKP